MEDDGNGTRSDDRNAVDLMLDLFVFVPVGLLAESHALLPKLAETGRQTVNDRVQLARMIGQFAVNRGRRRVDEAVNNLRTNAASGPAPSSAGDGVDEDTEVDIPVRLSADEEVMADEIGIIEDDLAIPSYDSLAASQVVPRLEGLTPVELESVRRYEEAHRARKTVLGKITLLQSQQ